MKEIPKVPSRNQSNKIIFYKFNDKYSRRKEGTMKKQILNYETLLVLCGFTLPNPGNLLWRM